MTRPRVWAPVPRRVDLVVEGLARPMERGRDDWWASDRDLLAGTDYAFRLDGREPALPDPRSAWQPAGVDGPSRTVDHAAFRWTDAGFRAPPLSSAVFYELHIGTFSPAGTFDGAIDRLDHLVRLGVTHVEMMPVAEFSGNRGWGYDGVDLFAPHHAYGGPDGLKRLIDACHGRGLAVALDVVYNHLGPAGNNLDRFAPYFTTTHSSPWGAALNFDAPGSDEVRRFFIDNACMWLRDYHVDALRLDAIQAIADRSATHVLEEMAGEVRALAAQVARPLVLIAESDLNDPRVVRPREAGGLGLDAHWNDDFHHALHAVITGEQTGYYEDVGRLADLAKSLEQVYVHDGVHSRHRNRRHGRPPSGLNGDRFLVFAQNHDQVGNRAVGERLAHLSSLARARVAAAIVFTSPFVPLLFMGEEWGASTPFLFFTDHADPELGEAVRTGRRTEFQAFGWDPSTIPDPQDPATFQQSRLRWDETDAEPHAGMLDWYRRLIALRRTTPDLLDPRFEFVGVTIDEGARTIVVRRGSTVLAANLGAVEHTVAIGGPADGSIDGEVLLASPSGLSVDSSRRVRMPPDSVAIVRVRS